MDVAIIGICGGSGSGKSTLASSIAEELGDDRVAVVPFDAYYRDLGHLSPTERVATNFDHPSSLDVDLYARHLDALRLGQAVGIPEYDFASHTRTGDHQVCEARPVIIAEGILLLAEAEIRSRLDLCVFLDVPEGVRFERRLARDTVERGRAPDDVRRQFDSSVAPMHDRFVQPYGTEADLVHEHPWEVRSLATDLATAALRVLPA